ncbi:MAG: histone deacetylase [Sulfurimonadaceae bacterium]|nr:histone deacetylase [Sulfurimonadaceae bacterium]
MVGFIYDPIFLEHDTGTYHPENANRLRSILRHIEPFQEELLWLEPISASYQMLLSVHPDRHIEMVEQYANAAMAIDADTQTSEHSYEAALKAAGAGITAIDAVADGKVSSAFAAVRPPGHHATKQQSMGFCLFNNIAVAARYAQECGYEKVLVIDFDVHHGNGTQDIFYDDPTVFYFSSHQYPAYPGTGDSTETGSGEGEGYTLNFPLLPESDDEDILPIYEEQLPDVIDSFQPDIILVSAGYDLHRSDPLASLMISTGAIGSIVQSIMECSSVPKLFFLEGGYNLEALGECVATTLKVMMEFD